MLQYVDKLAIRPVSLVSSFTGINDINILLNRSIPTWNNNYNLKYYVV